MNKKEELIKYAKPKDTNPEENHLPTKKKNKKNKVKEATKSLEEEKSHPSKPIEESKPAQTSGGGYTEKLSSFLTQIPSLAKNIFGMPSEPKAASAGGKTEANYLDELLREEESKKEKANAAKQKEEMRKQQEIDRINKQLQEEERKRQEDEEAQRLKKIQSKKNRKKNKNKDKPKEDTDTQPPPVKKPMVQMCKTSDLSQKILEETKDLIKQDKKKKKKTKIAPKV